MDYYTDKQQREVFHFVFLEKLLKISDPRLYALKGGVNLRFFFASPRYSEDMDIDVFAGNVDTLKKNGYKILNDAPFRRILKTFGIEDIKINDPAKAKHTETTQRFRLRLVNANGEEFPTKVEFRRTSLKKAHVVQESILPEIARTYKRLSYECRHYDSKSAISQKIQALGGRTEVQARDAFDLYIFHLAGHLKKNEVRTLASPKERLEAIQALDTLNFEDYISQVVEFLDLENQRYYRKRETWNTINKVISGVLT